MSTHIIDTHTHFFDPSRPGGVPWPSSADEVLYRPTYPDRFLELAVPHGVTGTVVVEASSWIEDNQWILDLALENTAILGLIGNLDVFNAEFRENLDRFSANLLFRGIRLGSNALKEEYWDDLITAMEVLAARELALDLLVHKEDLPSVVRIADSVPDLHIMLDHVAHVPINGQSPDPTWGNGIAACGQRENVYCKVSGLVEAAAENPAPTSRDFYRPTLDALVECFGTDRLSYGSNWPVCEKAGEYSTVFDIPQAYFSELGAEVSDAIFRKNALDCYRCVESRAKS